MRDGLAHPPDPIADTYRAHLSSRDDHDTGHRMRAQRHRRRARAEEAVLSFRDGSIMFLDKIVQIAASR